MSEVRTDAYRDNHEQTVIAASPVLGMLALLHKVQADPRLGLGQEGQPMHRNAHHAFSRLTDLELTDDTTGVLQATAEAVFDNVIFPDYREVRANKRGSNQAKVEARVAEVSMYIRGNSFDEIGRQLGRPAVGLRVNFNQFVHKNLDSFPPNHIQERLQRILFAGAWDEPVRPSASERAAVSKRPRIAGRLSDVSEKTVPRRVDLTGSMPTETEVLPRPRWENLYDLPDEDWQKKLTEATVGWSEADAAGVQAMVQNRTEGTLGARDRIAQMLDSRILIRPARQQQDTDILSQLQYDTLKELTRLQEDRRGAMIVPTAETVAMKLFDRYEKEGTTFEDVVAEGLLVLTAQDRQPCAQEASERGE